jgi:hypothetical protein
VKLQKDYCTEEGLSHSSVRSQNGPGKDHSRIVNHQKLGFCYWRRLTSWGQREKTFPDTLREGFPYSWFRIFSGLKEYQYYSNRQSLLKLEIRILFKKWLFAQMISVFLQSRTHIDDSVHVWLISWPSLSHSWDRKGSVPSTTSECSSKSARGLHKWREVMVFSWGGHPFFSKCDRMVFSQRRPFLIARSPFILKSRLPLHSEECKCGE